MPRSRARNLLMSITTTNVAIRGRSKGKCPYRSQISHSKCCKKFTQRFILPRKITQFLGKGHSPLDRPFLGWATKPHSSSASPRPTSRSWPHQRFRHRTRVIFFSKNKFAYSRKCSIEDLFASHYTYVR